MYILSILCTFYVFKCVFLNCTGIVYVVRSNFIISRAIHCARALGSGAYVSAHLCKLRAYIAASAEQSRRAIISGLY